MPSLNQYEAESLFGYNPKEFSVFELQEMDEYLSLEETYFNKLVQDEPRGDSIV